MMLLPDITLVLSACFPPQSPLIADIPHITAPKQPKLSKQPAHGAISHACRSTAAPQYASRIPHPASRSQMDTGSHSSHGSQSSSLSQFAPVCPPKAVQQGFCNKISLLAYTLYLLRTANCVYYSLRH